MLKNSKNAKEQGQTLVIVAIGIIFLGALLALGLDGGFSLMNRRYAQVASDAGAYAGARVLCGGDYPTDSYASLAEYTAEVATTYAQTHNDADNVSVTVGSNFVNVVSFIENDSFFAGLFNQATLPVSAEAEAGCFSPSFGEGVLPTAWACHPPIVGGFQGDSEDCIMQSISPEELEDYIDPNNLPWEELPPELYIIMDSDPTTTSFCLPNGSVDCDLDNDGENDIVGAGDRDWLDLDGSTDGSDCSNSEGAQELVCWIEHGYDGTLRIHDWLPKQSGQVNQLFNAINSYRLGDIVTVPVFDHFCDGDPTLCTLIYHTDDDVVIPNGGVSTTWYHIVGFAAFYVSCVDAAGTGSCPGHNAAVDAGLFSANTKSVEGFFINGFIGGVGGTPSDGTDTGIFTILLRK